MHDFLNIGETCRRTNLLEGVLDFVCSLHFLFHFLLEELRPHLLNHVVLLHLQFVGVLVFICSCFSDLLLTGNAVHPSLECFFLIFNGFVQAFDPLLSMSLLFINVIHECLQLLLSLKARLLGFAGFLAFFLEDNFFLFVRLTDFSGWNIDSNNVLFDAVDHVIVCALEHQFEIVLVLDHRELLLGGHYHVCLTE